MHRRLPGVSNYLKYLQRLSARNKPTKDIENMMGGNIQELRTASNLETASSWDFLAEERWCVQIFGGACIYSRHDEYR